MPEQPWIDAAIRQEVRAIKAETALRDLTTGEAEAYRRGFADARERAAKECDQAAVMVHDERERSTLAPHDVQAMIEAAGLVSDLAALIRAMEPKE